MVGTFYRGPELAFMHRLARAVGLRHGGRGLDARGTATTTASAVARVVGSFLAITSCLRGLALHPGAGRGGLPVSLLDRRAGALVCLSGAAQSALLALCFHRDAAHAGSCSTSGAYSSAYAVR
ncbi:hypothetical protein C2845_PM05G14920 [Panicum miliaceum]|uniref:Uncharacterized protein n=1 Tax=Panicum miliaceum TaxID=4540 RepID=A0A3L6T330_PANMI|nr:hypothetical protein C2845_PM05G14920 [Panicum miliaceum]